MKTKIILNLTLIVLIISSCTKEKMISKETLKQKNSSEQLSSNSQNDFELTQTDKSAIEKLYPGLKFNDVTDEEFSNSNFVSKGSVIHFVDSIKQSLLNVFSNQNQTVKTKSIAISNSVALPGDTVIILPDVIVTSTIPSGGMFSSFTLSFLSSNNQSTMSNQSLSLTGVAIGWWWNTGFIPPANGNNGIINGTATYFYGLFTYSYPFTLNYTYDPVVHKVFYEWSTTNSDE